MKPGVSSVLLSVLALILDRLESPFPGSTSVHMVIPSIHKGQVNPAGGTMGSASIAGGVDVAAVLQKVMTDSPVAPWFAKSKVIECFGCNQELRPLVREPARPTYIAVNK
jgi:hypothetical protein